jgi:hypothetical protein
LTCLSRGHSLIILWLPYILCSLDMPPFFFFFFCSGRFLAFSLIPAFMCYFLKAFEYFSSIKIKISTTLKKKYNCNKLPWTKTQNKSIWVQQLTFRISQKISVWKFWKFNFITHEIENCTSKDTWTWWSVWQILCWIHCTYNTCVE